jgi:hypothetical protein
MAANRIEPLITALHYLFSHTGEATVVVHCLDLDIVASGASIEEAEASLNAKVLQQIGSCWVNGNFSQLSFKAPAENWQALEFAKQMSPTHLSVEIPPVVLAINRMAAEIPVMRLEMLARAAA